MRDARCLSQYQYIIARASTKTPDDLVLYEGQRLTSISREERSHFDFANISRDLEEFHRRRLVAASWDNFPVNFTGK